MSRCLRIVTALAAIAVSGCAYLGVGTDVLQQIAETSRNEAMRAASEAEVACSISFRALENAQAVENETKRNAGTVMLAGEKSETVRAAENAERLAGKDADEARRMSGQVRELAQKARMCATDAGVLADKVRLTGNNAEIGAHARTASRMARIAKESANKATVLSNEMRDKWLMFTADSPGVPAAGGQH